MEHTHFCPLCHRQWFCDDDTCGEAKDAECDECLLAEAEGVIK